MIDVHPPEHTPHSWRDFFIHIATIVVGLIIAVGLEQSVEWVHHLRERNQIEHELVIEAQNNLELMKLDYVYFDKAGPELTALRSQARSLRAHAASVPHSADLSALTGPTDDYYADSPVWDAAKEGGIVTLLPRREAALYDLVYGQQNMMAAEFDRYEQLRSTLANFCLRFTAEPNQPLDLASLSTDELEQYNVLLANLQGQLTRFRRETDYARLITQKAANGETSDQEAFETLGVSKRH